MTARDPVAPAVSAHVRAGIAWAASLGLLALALAPALTRSHVEGFSYLTETMSFLLPEGTAADPLWPMAERYFHLSRPGVIWAMAPLSALSPGRGYDLLMWIALPVFLSGLVVVARAWSAARWLSAVAALLLLPIALEAHFFHNDNVLATGLSLWAIVLTIGGRGVGAAAGAGALYGFAVLCRLDQVLLGPLFAILLVLHASGLAGAVWRALAMALGFALVHAAFALVDPQGANVLLRLSVVAEADALWGRDAGPLAAMVIRDASTALIAVGLGLPAMAAGAVALLARSRGERDLRRRAMPLVLIGYPLFVYALTVGKYYDPRGLMVMLPMLAPLAAAGLDRWVIGPVLGDAARPDLPRAVRGSVAALLLLPVFVPGVPLMEQVLPLDPETENAAPTLTGRLWHAGAWRDWQEARFHAPEAAAASFLRGLPEGETVVAVTTDWTEDRRLQHAGLVQGFVPAGSAPGPCAGMAEAWAGSDGRVLIHLRAHVPFLPGARETAAAVLLARGAACLESFPEARRVAVAPRGIDLARARPGRGLRPRTGGYFGISDADIAALEALAAETLAARGPDDPAAEAEALLAEAARRLE